MRRTAPCAAAALLALVPALFGPAPRARAEVKAEEVERAIRDGVKFLLRAQNPDGSWPDADEKAHTGTTSLVVLALLTAGEKPESPPIARALDYLQQFTAADLDWTYSVALQTMVFAAADPQLKRFGVQVAGNVNWLEEAQIRPGDHNQWPGSWTYESRKLRPGDNSNTQYALLGLHAASEVGVPVDPRVWALARSYWEDAQRFDGGWTYWANALQAPSGSMSCAGISSLVIAGLRRFQGQEFLVGEEIRNCGQGGVNPHLQRGIDWLATNFRVSENPNSGQSWKFYYLYGLERAGRLSGVRFFGDHDWYREGAEFLIHTNQRDPLRGAWTGSQATERDPLVATSFALLFLAKGRAPVLINKLRHGPGNDWDNDRDDVRNLVGTVSRDWGHLLTWQVVDPGFARVEDLMQAPIAYFNGHEAPVLDAKARKLLREYVEQGGFILAEACCSEPVFDEGFRALMKEVFPEPEYDLHPLAEDHAVWRANPRFQLSPDVHPLWGIDVGCRTAVIYTPEDLSCFWNQMEVQPENPKVLLAQRVGQSIVDYATGRELPADKLTVREPTKIALGRPRRGALQIAKLRHAGDWNVAPLAIPNLTTLLRQKLEFDVVINHKELITPRDPNLVNFPLVYMHGRAATSFSPEEIDALRMHLEPGGGVLFADAACGSPAFDTSFRKLVATMFPDNPLQPIPKDDELYTEKVYYDLSKVEYSRAAGGGRDYPQLEGVKLGGHWAIIYSPNDIGCALERKQGGLDCKGYTHESALKIAANIVIYATLP